jgi:hypothetical protein
VSSIRKHRNVFEKLVITRKKTMKINKNTYPRLMMLVLAFAAASVTTPAGAITYIGNVGSVSSNLLGTNLNITVGAGGVAAGNTIVVGFASRGASTYNAPVVTDSAANTYNLATNAVTYGHGRSYIYYAHVNNALVNGNNITITTSSVSNRVAVASVFSGLLDANLLDKTLANPTGTSTSTNGNNPTVGPTATTIQANELIIGVIGTEEATDAGVGTWQNGFTAGPQIKTTGTSTNEWRVSLGYQIVSATGPYTAAKTVVNNPYWAATIATFKGSLADTTAPTPNPATFAIAPTATGPTAVTMTATVGTDASGPVEYLFTETTGHAGGSSSGWRTNQTYVNTGLSPATTYSYTVTMRDALNNTGMASTVASVTTPASAGTITYVGDVGGVSSNMLGTNLDIAVGTGGVATGNTIVVGFASRGATTYNAPVVTDSETNTYNPATNSVTYGHGRSYIYYAHVKNALVNGNKITITTSSVSNRVAVASVFSGLLDTNLLDKTLANPAGTSTVTNGNNPTVGPTATTVQANELIIGVIGTEESTNEGVGTWQNNFETGPQVKTTGTSTNEWRVSLGYQTVSATGQYTAAKILNTNAYWAATIATFKGSLSDTVPPVITTCATNMTLNAGTSCQAAIPDLTAQVVASDDSGSVTITQSPVAGTLVGLGDTVVTITVSDAANNQATCQATITVIDVTPPVITTCATDMTLNANTNCQAAIPNLTSQVVASDSCSAVTITQSPVAGTLVGLGNTVVTLTVKDAANNQATCQATIAVIDVTPPVITTCATDMTLNANTNCQAAIPDLTSQVVTSDSCSAVTITQSPVAGTLVGLGNTVVTLTVKDAANNQATCQATIAVIDVTPPVITTCATNMTLNANTNCQAAIPDLTSQVVASDSCSAVTITQSPVAGTLVGLGATVVTITVSDAATNQATCQATITVVDGSVPDITAQPQSVTNLVGTTATFTVTATSCSAIGYQWMFGTNLLSGENAATLTITNVQTRHAGGYTVILTNAADSITSGVATLTVLLPAAPALSTRPMLLPNGHFYAGFTGTPNVPYTVKYADEVTGPWQMLTNLTSDGNGLIGIDDILAAAPDRRFYRVVYP